MTWNPVVNSEFWDPLVSLTEIGQQGESWFLAPSPSLPTPDSILPYQGPCTFTGTLKPASPSSGYSPMPHTAAPLA